jgi:protein-L-isoaspartate O-methyltransferase
MAVMLRELDLRESHHVLEIGSGTGYNAAVIAELVGAGGVVTSVEVDPEAAATAAANLAGRDQVTVVAANALTWSPSEPYDRIVVTADAHGVPRAWADLLVPGGVLVTNLSGPLCAVLLTIRRSESGLDVRAADCPEVGFVPLVGTDPAGLGDASSLELQELIRMPGTTIDPVGLPDGLAAAIQHGDRDFLYFCQLQRPDWRIVRFRMPSSSEAENTVVYNDWVTTSLWLRDDDQIWATYRGDRSLADDIIALYGVWLGLDRPAFSDLRVGIESSGDIAVRLDDRYSAPAYLPER